MYLHEKEHKDDIRLNMDLPNVGRFNTKINVPDKNAELSRTLLSLPLYLVSELRRLIDLGIKPVH